MYEELVQALRHCVFGDCIDCSYRDNCASLNTKAADAIEGLEKSIPHWIPVTERLPEPGWYLVRCNEVHKHVHRIAYYYDTVWYENSNNITKFVTHWISLPEPPKEEHDGI